MIRLVDGAPNVLETALYFLKQQEKAKMNDPKTEAERAAGQGDYQVVIDFRRKMEREPTPEEIFALGFGMVGGYEQGRAAGKQEAQRWIACREQMPKMGAEIVLHYPAGNDYLWVAGTVDGSDDGLFVDFDLDGHEITTACHWMPLPPAPDIKALAAGEIKP